MSKTSRNLRAFSWGKFSWTEMICVKKLTFCNSGWCFKPFWNPYGQPDRKKTVYFFDDFPKVVEPLLDFCLRNPERVISIEVTDHQAKEGVVRVAFIDFIIVMIITMTMIIVMTMIIMIIIVSIQFATDHRLLVEPACGAVLASIYRSFCSSDYDWDWGQSSLKSL